METNIDSIDRIIQAQTVRRHEELRAQYRLWDRGQVCMDVAARLLAEQLGERATPINMLRHQVITAVVEV